MYYVKHDFMAVKGVFLKDVPFYRQVEVSSPSKMTTLDGGEVDLSKGDIVAVVGCPHGAKKWTMRVMVFSGETRAQVAECLVPGSAIVSGEMLCEESDPIVEDKLFFRRRRKMDGEGTDGEYVLPAETPDEKGERRGSNEGGIGKSVISGLG